MAVTCRLEDTARPVVNLDSPHLSAVRRLGGARNVQAVTELLRQRVPGLDVQEDYYDDARPAWWQGGTVFINLNRADVSSPIHELSEIWGAVYEQQQPEAYQQTLEMMRGTTALEQVQKAYPDLDETNQLREALHLQVQQDAGKYLPGGEASGPVRRLWDFVSKLLYRLSGGVSPAKVSKLNVAQLTQLLAKELVLGTGGILSELSQQDLQRLGSYTRDQRLTNADLTHEAVGVTHTGDLLEFLSGQQPNASGVNLTQKSRQLVRQFGEQPSFKYTVFDDEGRKQQGEWAWESTDPHERIQQVQQVLRDAQAAPDGEALRLATSIFYRLREPLKQSELADNRPGGMSEAEARLAYGPHGIFPEFVPGEQVVRYSAEGLGTAYNAALDTGNLLVHLDKDGRPKGVAAITRQRLGEKEKSPSLLGGLQYFRKKTGSTGGDGFVGKALRTAGAGKAERVTLSASPEQLQKLQAQLLAMYLTQQGHTLSTVSVANVASLEAGREQQNAVTRLLPVQELTALRSIRQQAAVRQLLDASGDGGQRLLALLDDDSLYEPGRYTTDYVGSLLTNFKGVDTYSQQKIQQYASEYEQQKSDVSLSRLLQAVQARRNALLAGMDPETQASELAQNAELVQLAHAEAQLRQVSELLNPHRGLGTVEKMYLDYLNNASPAMVFLVNRYKVLKTRITDAFVPRAKQRKQLIEALRAEKGGNRLVDKEQDMYRNLVQTRKAWRYNEDSLDAKGNPLLEQVEVPTWHFKTPGSAEFEKLTAAEQNFIQFELAQIEDQFVRWHRESHRDLNTGELGSEAAAQAYYDAEWGQGQIPLTPASVSTRRWQGDWLGSYQDSVHELLSQNPHFDDAGGQSLHLREYYQGQGGSGQGGAAGWGSERRQQLLGISRTDDIHPETGEPLGVLVSGDWQKTQARFDQDLGRGQAVWSVELLRHEFQQNAEQDYKLATVLLQDEEASSGLLRQFQAGENRAGGDERHPGRYAWLESDQAVNLKKAFRQLFLGDTQQGGGSAGAQRIARAAAVGASIFRTAIYKGNILRPIRQTVSGLVGQLAPILASQSAESKKVLDSKHLKSAVAVVADARNWDYLLQLGVHLDVISPSARALAANMLFSGDQRRVSDALGIDALFDRLGDEVLSLTTMVLHMQTSGAWNAYSWHADNQEFVYNEAADRKQRGDAVVDSVKTNLVANGVLEAGEALNRAYDLPLLRSLESSVSDVKGGYSPASSSELGASVLGNQLLGQRRWYVRRVLNAIGGKRVSAARGYKSEDGKWVGLTEEGQWQSLQTGFWALAGVSFNPMKAGQVWQGMEPQEQENLQRVAANLGVSAAAMVAVMAVAGLWDDDEDEQNKKRTRQMGVLDTIVQEAFVLDNVGFALDSAANPFLMVDWLRQSATGVGNVLMGDFSGAGRVLKSKTGLGKVWVFGEQTLEEEE